MEPFRQSLYSLYVTSQSFSRKMYFPLNSSNDVLIVFPYNFSKLILILKQFLTRMQKILSGRMVRDGEKPHVSFKAYDRIKIFLMYLYIAISK